MTIVVKPTAMVTRGLSVLEPRLFTARVALLIAADVLADGIGDEKSPICLSEELHRVRMAFARLTLNLPALRPRTARPGRERRSMALANAECAGEALEQSLSPRSAIAP
ncbi:hypothetical protein HLH33_17795 [Gluconacetobacter diazotrophicus]|uniref:Uncharacterized protein n=1 Tax=Gluconacetobacter diazotrophicus TaxID=33996 RepID=A0A7W4NI30_GLUDI|nr:hypothetical protein [Gluconacetobacter diazotrophicus]MBB2158126.1 hypothetical protein [Gluconacetobacter diazotrophicus]